MKIETVMTREQWEEERREEIKIKCKGFLAIAIGSVMFYLAMATIAAIIKSICNMDILISVFNLI